MWSGSLQLPPHSLSPSPDNRAEKEKLFLLPSLFLFCLLRIYIVGSLLTLHDLHINHLKTFKERQAWEAPLPRSGALCHVGAGGE